jgi:hypothetical protein
MVQKIYQRVLLFLKTYKGPVTIMACTGGGSYLFVKQLRRSRPNLQVVPDKKNLTAVPDKKNLMVVPDKKNLTVVPDKKNLTVEPDKKNLTEESDKPDDKSKNKNKE